MTGKTHLAIGMTIGAMAAVYYTNVMEDAAIYIAVASFSALAADLDGNSMLSSKLGKLSKLIREFTLWFGILFAALIGYYYVTETSPSPLYLGAAGAVFLLGLVAKQGVIRNVLVSVVGAALVYAGYVHQMHWLVGFGLFVAFVPWLKHRGMTHTIWAIPIWGAIGWGLEQHIQLEGIALISILGYASHLIADTLTPSGVKWLYPLMKKSFKIRF